MADIPTSSWSETAASNTAAAPDGWPANSGPTIVYSTDREMMGAIKREWNRQNPTVTSGGSANVQTLTYTTAPTAYVTGMRFSFIAGFTNTSSATLNVNALGAKAVQLAGSALTGSEIISGKVVEVIYDGTQFQILATPGLLANIRKGKLNCGSTVTLTANATTTTLTDANIDSSSLILWSPTTANAATHMTDLRVGSPGSGSVTLTHSNTADVDKTYNYIVIN